MKLLINKFGPLVGGEYNIETDFQSFKEQLRSTEFSMFVSAEQVCKLLVKQTLYLGMYPEICFQAQIALKIHLSTVWPERGFSTLTRIKTKSQNRLLNSTLAALLLVPLKGPNQLSDKEAASSASKWLHLNTRWSVTNKTVGV